MTNYTIHKRNETKDSCLSVYNSVAFRFFFNAASLVSSAASLIFFVAFFFESLAYSCAASRASSPKMKKNYENQFENICMKLFTSMSACFQCIIS
jgi:hypothetical protein